MISKLRGRSLAELSGRLAQQARALAERRGIIPEAALPTGLRTKPKSPWPLIASKDLVARLPTADRCTILERAELVCDGRFALLGISSLSYGSPVNWQRDPLTQREAPLTHWSRVPYLDVDRVGDHKLTWEVNRHQWLITLGQAWVLTNDARYPETAARLLREWLVANPPKLGMNWCSALELAFRVQSWIHALRLFDDAPQLAPELQRGLVASAALQTLHIEQYLSTWFSPNTHLTGEALALLAVGCAWPDLPHAKRWREKGWNILCEELPKQVRHDGVYFEQSAWYQAYQIDFYLLGMELARGVGLSVPPEVPERIHNAARALRAVTRPDGTVAMLGDDDGGRTLPMVPLPLGDLTDTLWRAAHALNDPALTPPTDAGRSTLLWLEGAAAYDAAGNLAAGLAGRQSSVFRDGGWVSLTEPGASSDRDHWMVFDAGPHGALSYAHAHADALSIDLSVHGVPLFVDPGTCAYVGEKHRHYRSTSAHNTVTVDGFDSSEQGASFNWRSAAETHLVSAGWEPAASFVVAFHDGYMRLTDPVLHRRTILRIDRHYWLMFDTLDTAAAHDISISFQASAQATLTTLDPHAYRVTAKGVALHLVFDPRLSGRIEERTVSSAYAHEMRAPALVATARTLGAATLCSVFGSADEAAPSSIVSFSTIDDVWRVSHSRGSDLVARPNGTAITLGPATFDGAAFAVVGEHDPQLIVAAGAGTLHLEGRSSVLGADHIRVARRALDGTWTMES